MPSQRFLLRIKDSSVHEAKRLFTGRKKMIVQGSEGAEQSTILSFPVELEF